MLHKHGEKKSYLIKSLNFNKENRNFSYFTMIKFQKFLWAYFSYNEINNEYHSVLVFKLSTCIKILEL